jgi:hypothetical protein
MACRFSSPQIEAEAIINLVNAPPAIENIMHLLKNDSVLVRSCHRHKQPQCCEGVSSCNPLINDSAQTQGPDPCWTEMTH